MAKKTNAASASLQSRLLKKMAAVGTIMPFEQSMVAKPRTWLPSDFLNLNWALGHGVPFGCLWELIGAESAGKTSLAMSLAASLQRTHNALVIPYDTERMDDSMLMRSGLDLSSAAIPVPEARDSISSVVNNMMEMIHAIQEAEEEGDYEADGPVPVIMIWDSIAATPTQTIKQAMANKRDNVQVGITTEQMSATAAQLTVALKNLHPAIVKTNILAIFINQMRVDIQTGPGAGWGGPGEHSGGGRALKHAANIRGKLKYENMYKEYNGGKKDLTHGNQTIGITSTLTMIKNKLAAPFKKIQFVNMFQSGIDMYTSVVLHAIFDLEEAEILPRPVRGRIDWNGKRLLFTQFIEEIKQDKRAWEELKERVIQAQKDLDSNITPDDMSELQHKADNLERQETGEYMDTDNEDGD